MFSYHANAVLNGAVRGLRGINTSLLLPEPVLLSLLLHAFMNFSFSKASNLGFHVFSESLQKIRMMAFLSLLSHQGPLILMNLSLESVFLRCGLFQVVRKEILKPEMFLEICHVWLRCSLSSIMDFKESYGLPLSVSSAKRTILRYCPLIFDGFCFSSSHSQ